jgi:hypothetical protein
MLTKSITGPGALDAVFFTNFREPAAALDPFAGRGRPRVEVGFFLLAFFAGIDQSPQSLQAQDSARSEFFF